MISGKALARFRLFVVEEDPPVDGCIDDLLDYDGNEDVILIVSRQPRWPEMIMCWLAIPDHHNHKTQLMLTDCDVALALLSRWNDSFTHPVDAAPAVTRAIQLLLERQK